jgi:diguanylate cyclase (GGDEF)-like protein
MSVPADETLSTIAPHSAPTSLDPYGQLIKMLMPRALSIGIYDRDAQPLWLSDGCDGPDLTGLVEEALSHREAAADGGLLQAWGGDQPTYVCVLKDARGASIGAVAVACRESSGSTPRPFSLVQGLLRPALQVLERELVSQYSIDDLQKTLEVRERDLELVVGTSATQGEGDADDLAQVVQSCVAHLDCAFGALLIPDKNIAICRAGKADGVAARAGAETVTKTHRHLLAWSQVQRRTITINDAPPGSPLGAVPYKILSCPILHAAQRVVGILALYKPRDREDFSLREIRLAEVLGRRVSNLLQIAYDPATGLLTRPAFEKRSIAMLAGDAAQKASHCVVYLDLDRLHVINENHGMHVGDDVIIRVADAVRRRTAGRRLAARISGDRFAIFLPDTDLGTAEEFAAALCSDFAQLECIADGKHVEVTGSFGVARIVFTRHPLSHGLAAAEVACKAAKDRGRNRVEVYQEADHSIIRRYQDVTLVGTLREALATDRFRLEAQPIVAMSDERAGPRFELLLRMIDAAGETVAPDKFLSAAERYQLAPAIDRWVVKHVLSSLAGQRRRLQAIGARFAINISGQSIGDEEFPSFLETELRANPEIAPLLSFELTETAAVTNIVRAEALMRRLQDLGHEVALDDFGRGLSSLSYLKTLPVSCLKIDGAFIRDVATNERSQAMVSAIVQLARAIGLTTTAECVESDSILKTIHALGVDYGQGFSIGRPRPLEQVLSEQEASDPTTSAQVLKLPARKRRKAG